MDIRNLNVTDYDNYINHIKTNVTHDVYNNFVSNVLSDYHKIIVVIINNLIIGSGTIIIERKMTHNGCKMGHIENILVDEHYRNKGIGAKIINELHQIAKLSGCYRIDLICSNDLINYYKKIIPDVIEQSGLTIMIPENYN